MENLNRVAKWRTIFASWFLGTRSDTDEACKAYKDLVEKVLILRVENNALTQLLIKNGHIDPKEFGEAIEAEAVEYQKMLEKQFPGISATEYGMNINLEVAIDYMKNWPE